MLNQDNDIDVVKEIPAIKSEIKLIQKNLFSDDISKTKNRLWIFKDKLSENDTFSDFGFLVSIKISEYTTIFKEYGSNVANKLLTLVSDYMILYMDENQLSFDIVRYSDDNFLIFIKDLDEEEIEAHMANMQKGMSNYKFKQRHKIFNLTCYYSVMQYIKNESFSYVLDRLDEKLFFNKV